MTLKKLKAALEKARKAQWDDSVEVKADEAVIKTAELGALIAVAEAAQELRKAQVTGEDEIIGHGPEGSTTWFESLEWKLDTALAALGGERPIEMGAAGADIAPKEG
jgi:hypothetical protein